MTHLTERERKVLALIAARGLTSAPFPSLREIATELGTKERTIAARTLTRLVAAKEVERVRPGVYRLPAHG